MAARFVVFCSIMAIARAGVLAGTVRYTATPHKVAYANPAVDAVAATQQNVVRSFGGTVSTYSKAVDTPYSSVRKADTRISNNVYSPAYEKTVTYAAAPATVNYAAAPVVEKQVSYAAYPAHVTKSLAYAAPALVQKAAPLVAAPVVSKTVYAAPPAPAAVVYAHSSAPSHDLYTHAIPKAVVGPVSSYAVAKPVATYASAVPVATTNYNHGTAATTYTHNAPGISGYGSSQTIRYSPAEMVSHMSFDGFGTHWGY